MKEHTRQKHSPIRHVKTSRVDCSCYGCAIQRQRAGIPALDRSAEPCDPSGACAKDGRCWTHSEWLDESRAICAADTACRKEGK